MCNKRVAILTAIIMLLVAGCNAFDRSQAIIGYACPVGKESHFYLSLSKKTGKLMFGHSGLGFIIQSYDFTLPRKPEARTVLTTTELILTSENLRADNISQLTSGQIVVDLRASKVSVSLMTRDGPFSGNGEYSLHYIE